MRHELKHDKLAAQIYELASAEAKTRRKAEHVYQLYQEIGTSRLFTEEELEYLSRFQMVLRPKENLLELIRKSKKELELVRKRAEREEKARLEREKELVNRVRARQQRIGWVIGVAVVVVACLFIYALLQSQYATESNRSAREIRSNLEQKSMLTESMKKELADIIKERSEKDPLEAKAYISSLSDQLPSAFIDPRDGTIYETVELRKQIWMAENLHYDAGPESWYYEDDPAKGETYGRLYTWRAAQAACPPGWRLPSDAEWRKMALQFGGLRDDNENNNGAAAFNALITTGNSNFGAVLAGKRRPTGSFFDLEVTGDYWSGTELNPEDAWLISFNSETNQLLHYDYSKSLGASCRCLKDSKAEKE